MQGAVTSDEARPLAFNFDANSFKVGDTVSYRVNGGLEGVPFVGRLVAVHDDHVLIAGDPAEPEKHYRGTRESRPQVDYSEI